MGNVDKTTLRLETFVLLSIFFIHGIGGMSTEAVKVSLLFAIAAMLSMLKYQVNQ